MLHTVYYVSLKSPWQSIKVVTGEVIVTQKRAWFIGQKTQKRRLVGSSIFYTEASANRARYVLLKKLQKDIYKYKTPNLFNLQPRVQSALQTYASKF